MKIMLMPDVERFLEIVESSAGSVFLHLPDDTCVDLKKDNTARQLLRLVTPGAEGLRFSLSESADVPAFIRYMTKNACPGNTADIL